MQTARSFAQTLGESLTELLAFLAAGFAQVLHGKPKRRPNAVTHVNRTPFDSSFPLLKLSSSDAFTLGNAFGGVHIFEGNGFDAVRLRACKTAARKGGRRS